MLYKLLSVCLWSYLPNLLLPTFFNFWKVYSLTPFTASGKLRQYFYPLSDHQSFWQAFPHEDTFERLQSTRFASSVDSLRGWSIAFFNPTPDH